MRRYLLFILLMFLATGCGKDKDPPRAGTITINNDLVYDNTLQTWIAYGFLFSEGKIVSNLESPRPDMILVAFEADGIVTKIQTYNDKGSFYKIGEYPDAASAIQTFKNLTSETVLQWADEADAIEPNQIWIFRTSNEKYAKFRTMDIFSEMRTGSAYSECTFEWVYQPDGTLTFP